MKRTLQQKLGLLGVVSLLSYAAAVFIAPLAYPGYNRIAQAVSDLSADLAPSRTFWNQLSCLYAPCGIVCCTLCTLEAVKSDDCKMKLGIALFSLMNWISAVGYAAFPLPDAGVPEGFQGVMHLVVTGFVVALSIISLALLIADFKRKRALAVSAGVALFMMMFGAVGTAAFPPELFGIPERFSVFSAVCFNAVLGIFLYRGKLGGEKCQNT